MTYIKNYTISLKYQGKWQIHQRVGDNLRGWSYKYHADSKGITVEQYCIDVAKQLKHSLWWATGARVTSEGKVIYQEEDT